MCAMTDAAKHLTRMPRDLYAEIQKTAEAEGVSANAFIVAVLAAAVGYRLPREMVEGYLRAAAKSAASKSPKK